MKLRIRGNSIRIRLMQDEVKQLLEVAKVEDQIDFGTANLRYRVISSPNLNAICAEFQANTIQVTLPEKIAKDFATSDQVGLEVQQELRGSNTLRILVEKDFACLKPRADEDESNAFPNPNLGCGC